MHLSYTLTHVVTGYRDIEDIIALPETFNAEHSGWKQW